MPIFEIPKTTLYYKGAKGEIREWSIYQDNQDIVIHHGVHQGARQEIRETILKGKAARNIQQQIISRINSRINKQKLKGYKNTLEEAQQGATNALGLVKPMLAIPYQKVKNLDYSTAWVQMKYDGHRCLITNQKGKLIAYSRNGKIIDTIDHILKDIDIPEGVTLDGELYCHGFTLQEIGSWIKRKQARTLLLKYHIYDLVHNEYFAKRLSFLRDLKLGLNAKVVDTWHFSEMASLRIGLNEARERGYEGLMLRTGNFPYENAKRSKSLLKVKSFLDSEFLVVDITLSSKNRAVLHCSTGNNIFKVSAPGSQEEKLDYYNNRDQYIGKLITVEYSILTKDGKPFQPVAIAWRD